MCSTKIKNVCKSPDFAQIRENTYLCKKFSARNETFDCSFSPLGRLSEPATRHRDDKPQRGRLAAPRRDGRRIRAQYHHRNPRSPSHRPPVPEEDGRAPDDCRAAEVHPRAGRVRDVYDECPLRDLPAPAPHGTRHSRGGDEGRGRPQSAYARQPPRRYSGRY